MKNTEQDLTTLEKQLDEKGVKVSDTNFLFLDVSSTCTGYTKFGLDFINKKAVLKNVGALWLNTKWCHQEKYSFLFNAILTYFDVAQHVDHIVHESYAVNANRMMGVQVLPEMFGALKTAAWENGVRVSDIAPQSWRKQLGIKAEKNERGDRDWKIPTKTKILSLVDVPEYCVSNITGNTRRTPFDVHDAIGIGAGWLYQNGFKVHFDKNYKFNEHIGAF